MSSMSGLVPGLEGDTLMAQMNNLFEPPSTAKAVTEKPVAELHPYFKRPGKGHNHDCCDSCGEGGALICCDCCPASFHLQCHDPPLSDSEIPEGEWICIKCFASRPENQKILDNYRKEEKAKSQIVKSQQVSEEKPVSGRSPAKESGGKSPVKEPPVDIDWKPGGKGKKVQVARPSRATRVNKKTLMYADNSTEDEDEELLKQLAASLTTEKPPVTKVVTYKDLYIDHLKQRPYKTVSSPFSLLLSAAHTVNAVEFELPGNIGTSEKFPYSWKWSSDTDRQKRGQNGDDDSDRSTRQLCYVCVKSSRVGPLVKCDYCPSCYHLDCLDPPLSEIPCDVWMCPNHVEPHLDQKLLSSTSVTERVKLWDKYARKPIDTHSVKLQFMRRCSRLKVTSRNEGPIGSTSVNKVKVPGCIVEMYKRPRPMLPGPGYDKWMEPSKRRRNNLEGGDTFQEMEWVSGLVSLQTEILKDKMDSKKKMDIKVESKKDDIASNTSDDKTEVKENNLSPSSTLSTCSLSPRHSLQLSDQGGSLASQLTEYLAKHSEQEMSSLDPVVVQYLAHRQIQSLLPSPHTDSSQVMARASLTPLHSRRSPTFMTRRSLSVGTGSGVGLDLFCHGHCNMVSVKHATIFYDELSDQYEIINYSQFGTVVDEVVYSLNIKEVGLRYPSKDQPDVKTMAGIELPPIGGCYCDTEHHVGRVGCEGSGLLHHGSLVQFGCLQFVFSLLQSD